MTVPFRWDLSRREQLGRLVEGEAGPSYEGFLDDLRRASVRVTALGGDHRFVFAGRSPESLFDYLSGGGCLTRNDAPESDAGSPVLPLRSSPGVPHHTL
jgi:hypothetical protein